MGSMWWICTPTLPTGCLPAKVWSSTPLSDAMRPSAPARTERCTLPSVRRCIAARPVCRSASRPRQREVVVGGQGCRVERRDEHGFRRVVGVGDHAVGALHDHRPQSRAEQQLHDLLARRAAHVELRELLVLSVGIGRHGHGEHLALLAAIDGRHRTPDGRSKQDALVALAEEQRRTRLHPVAGLHQQFGSHTLEIEGRHSVLGGRRRFGQLLGGAAPEIDVETLA